MGERVWYFVRGCELRKGEREKRREGKTKLNDRIN